MEETLGSGMGIAELAYLGDAVLELMVREHLVRSGVVGAGRLNSLSRDFVTAASQSKALENILPLLTEEEEALFRRARNYSKASVPKSAAVVDYRRATGLEALFAALYLDGKSERTSFLFRNAYGISDKTDG